MYHYITIGSLVINMTGVGVIAFLCTFLYVVSKDAHRKGLYFHTFLRHIPLYIIIIYLCGTYFYYFKENFIVFPLSVEQLLLYITPYNYHFSTVGILIGVILGGWKFLKKQQKRTLRLSAWIHGIARGMVPLGIFLLLGDAFIGVQTDSAFFISAIRADSQVAIYDKVIPLGFYFSLLGLVAGSYLYLFGRSLALRDTYLMYALLSFFLGVLFIFQQYARRFVFDLGGVTIDHKQLFLWGLSVCFFLLRVRSAPPKIQPNNTPSNPVA